MTDTTDIIKKVYHNPVSGYSSVQSTYKEAKSIDKSITLQDVKDYLSKPNQLYLMWRSQSHTRARQCLVSGRSWWSLAPAGIDKRLLGRTAPTRRRRSLCLSTRTAVCFHRCRQKILWQPAMAASLDPWLEKMAYINYWWSVQKWQN